MVNKLLQQQAIKMRLKGFSYSQIKIQLGVSKSTLSGWLSSMPLSEGRIKQLRANSPIRIERYRNTMREKKEKKLSIAFEEISKKISKLSKRELFLSGFFLYWAEGTKTKNSAICLTNTNPKMLKFYIIWLKEFDVPADKLKVSLHLYADMNIKKQENYWSKELNIPLSQFRKSYIKSSLSSSITYHNGFGQGTCTITVDDARLCEKVMMGLKYIQDVLIK